MNNQTVDCGRTDKERQTRVAQSRDALKPIGAEKWMDVKPKRPLTIAVDFDGTLCANAWPDIGAAREDVIDTVKAAQQQGARLILWTNRIGARLREAVEWCADRGLHFDAVNENLPEVLAKFITDTRKVVADIYLDDKAVPATTDGCADIRRRLKAPGAFVPAGDERNATREESKQMTNAQWIETEPTMTVGKIITEARAWYAATHNRTDTRTASTLGVLTAWLAAEHTEDSGSARETTVVTTLTITHIVRGDRPDAQRIAQDAARALERGYRLTMPRADAPDDIDVSRVQRFERDPGSGVRPFSHCPVGMGGKTLHITGEQWDAIWEDSSGEDDDV